MGYLSLFALALKRIRNRWGLTLLSLFGIALTVGIIASIPIFIDAVGLRILQKELERHAFGNQNPPVAMRYYRIPNAPDVMTMQQAMDTGDWLAAMTAREVGLPVARRHIQIGSHALNMRALPDNTRYKERDLRQVRINCIVGVEEHIEISEGEPFSAADNSNQLLLWASPKLRDSLGLQIGEEFELFNYNAVRPDVPVKFRFAGVWRAKDPTGAFWYRDPHDLLEDEFLTSVGAFARFVAPIMPTQIDFSFWYIVLDESRIRFDRVDQYAKGVYVAQAKGEGMLPSIKVDRTPIEPLKDVQLRTQILQLLLFGFSLPVVALLLFFIASISSIAVRYQQNEAAILMSRGASRSQVFLISTFEGLILLAISTPLGILASAVLSQVMSLNTGFMTFDRPEPLPPAMQALDWRLVGLALGISLVARLIPALRNTRRTIVTYGRERARNSSAYTALRVLFSLIMVIATAYGYNQLRARGTFGMVSWQPGGGAKNDPLLFLTPTLFIVTSAWLIAQLFPLVMRIPDFFGRFARSPAIYLGLRNLARESAPYTAPLFVLATCLSLGAFEASVARSADTWLVERWQYKVGADYSFTLGTKSEQGMVIGKDAWLLPIAQFRKLPGVTDATRVGDYTTITSIGKMPKMRLIGIDRMDFARVAYFSESYAPEPLGDLLNRLAVNPSGLIVSPTFLQRTGLNVGDKLPLDVQFEADIQRIDFMIVGIYYYFPTVYENKTMALIGDLDYIHGQFGGISPYSLWLRTTPDMDEQLLKDTLDNWQVVPVNELNGRKLLAEDQQRLERVGIFGNLTVGFLSGSFLAWLGLLIYTFASLISRVRRFTILRALGLKIGQVLATVSIEYLGVIVYGILCGAAAGVAASKLFVPYFQFTEDPSTQIPPFVPQIAWEQITWIVLVYFAVLSIAEFIVLLRLTRREVFQALRLGDEE